MYFYSNLKSRRTKLKSSLNACRLLAVQRGNKKRGGRRAGAGRKPKQRPAAPCAEDIGPLIAARVIQARREREAALGQAISLRDLAASSGISVPTLRVILAGNGDPRASGLCGLAAALRVRAGWLLGE